MPRNGAGQYTLPQAPFVPLQTISSAAVNSDFSDLADAMTGSLARDGQGGMTGVLPLANAGANFVSDPDTGFVRLGANNPAIRAGGTDVVSVTPTGMDVTGALTQNGAAVGAPLGSVLAYAGATAPSLWLLCDGSAKSRTTYSALFAILGTTYGAGDGSTTFNLPDLRGRAPFGDDNMGGTAANRVTTAGSGIDGATIGANGGGQNVTLNAANIPSLTASGALNNPVSVSSNNWVASNSNDATPVSAVGGGAALGVAAGVGGTVSKIVSQGAATGAISATYTNASPTASPTMPPTLILNYIIYAGA